MADFRTNSQFTLKTVADTKYVAIPLGKPEYFQTVKKFRIQVEWGDGSTSTYVNDYDNEELAWDRNSSSSGEAQNQAPTSDFAVIPKHSYASPGQYTINIKGGFGNSWNRNDNRDMNSLKFTFAKSEDRLCLATPDRFEEISGGHIFVHGQGDFEDWENLKAINANLVRLTSLDPINNLVYDTTAEAKLAFINTFKNCKNLKQVKNDGIKFLANDGGRTDPSVERLISVEGCFDNCGYEGDVKWNFNAVTSYKNTFRKSKIKYPINLNFKNVTNFDYAFEDSLIGTSITSTQSIQTSVPGVWAFWKFVLVNSGNQVLWSNDGSLEVGASLSEPQSSTQVKTSAEGLLSAPLGNTARPFYMNPLSLNDVIDKQDHENNFVTGVKLITYHSATKDGAFSKIDEKAVDLSNFVTLQVFERWDHATTAEGAFKDHKALTVTTAQSIFRAKRGRDIPIGPIKNLDALFEGVRFLKTETADIIKIAHARPTSTSRFLRRAKNTKEFIMNVTETTNASSMFEDSDYSYKMPIRGGWSFLKCTDASYMFAGCTKSPGITSLWYKTSRSDRRDFSAVNVEGMFARSTGWAADLNLTWQHLKPTNMKAMFKNSTFNGSLKLGTTENCTDISYIFYGSSFVNTDTNIEDWKLENVVDASYAFYGSGAPFALTKWFTPRTDVNFKIKIIDGMFSESTMVPILVSRSASWKKTLIATTTSAKAFFKGNKSINPKNYASLFANTITEGNYQHGEPVLENIDEFFMNTNFPATAHRGREMEMFKAWALHPSIGCGNQVNVFKGTPFDGAFTNKLCRPQSCLSDDDVTSPPEVETSSTYSASEDVYLCATPDDEEGNEDEPEIGTGEFDTVYISV
jgi:hypothetical protein